MKKTIKEIEMALDDLGYSEASYADCDSLSEVLGTLRWNRGHVGNCAPTRRVGDGKRHADDCDCAEWAAIAALLSAWWELKYPRH